MAVTDNGSGMPADIIAKAFDRFFTDVGQGTGGRARQTWRSGLGRRTLGTDPSPRRQGRYFDCQSVEHTLQKFVRQRAGFFLRANQTVGQMITDGFLKASDICSGPAASACQHVGLSQ